MSKIFISYRRDDAAGYAQAVYGQLVQNFSKDRVFMDVDTIEPGVDFVRVIEKAVGECDVLVALIGKRWLRGESSGISRLDDAKDYVRLEISTALARDVIVIPVLVDGMTMPDEDSLPSPVQPITRRNAVEISNTRFNYDVEQLITAVRKILDATEAKRKADEEEERNRTEQSRIKAEAQRKLEEDRLLDEERQRAEKKEARKKAEEENRRRIEEERNRAQQEAEKRRLEAEAQRKAEEERLRKQEQQWSEEEAKRIAEKVQKRIDRELPNPWRTCGSVVAAMAVVVIFSFVLWWLSRQEIEPMGKPQSLAEPPQEKLEAQKEVAPLALETAKAARALASKGQVQQALALSGQALKLAEQEFGPKHEYVAFILDDLAKLHYQLNSPAEALADSTHAVAIIETKYPISSSEYASLANTQATILFAMGRLKEAEPLYLRAHDTFVSLANPLAETAARNLGIIYLEMSDYDNSERFFIQVLDSTRRLHGDNSVATAKATLDLAGIKLRQEATSEASQLATKARQVLATQVPVDPGDLASADVILARISIQELRLSQAEKRLRDAQKRLRDSGMETSLAGAAVLDSMAFVYTLRTQAVEAEPLYKEVLRIYRTVVGEAHPAIARTFHNLAIVYQDLGQYDQSEQFYEKAIDLLTRVFGPINASVAATRLERALLLTERGNSAKAIDEARAALAIFEQLKGPWEIKRGYAMSALGFALHRVGELDAAAASFNRALKLITKVRGDQSSDLPPGLTELAQIYLEQGRIAEAEASVKRAVAIREKDQAATPQGLAKSLSTLARLQIKQGRPRESLETAQRYVNIMRSRLDVVQRSLSAAALGENLNSRKLFGEFLEIAHSNLKQSSQDLSKLSAEMFEVAQFPHITDTAAAVTQMAARFAPQQTELASFVRQRQDAVEQWRAADRMLTEQLVSKNSLPRTREVALRRELTNLRAKIEGFDETLRKQFPKFSELTNPRPVSLQMVQKLLTAEEALLLQFTGETGTFVFLVRRNDFHLAHTNMNKKDLDRCVASLRKGLVPHRPPFDTAAAYYLYQNLILPFEDNLKGIHNIIAVADGAMQSLPLSVLLVSPTELPERPSSFQQLDFLALHYALSMVPSVSSFEALRSVVKPSKSREPFVGFGDPVLNGPAPVAREVPSDVVDKPVASINLKTLRLEPLPETRDGLTALAKSLKAGKNSLFFGEQATESVVKTTDLSRYRIIAFATHGLRAGESGLGEPALVLTPSNTETKVDDGLLTTSEIANLKLDADWVILSASNTAGPEGRPGAEGLSGLAKAFFYAGSRALMVSHWAVASDATVLLTTRTIQEFSQDPGIGRAEALRRAMLRLIKDRSHPDYAHPFFWAPFVIVGEGGTG